MNGITRRREDAKGSRGSGLLAVRFVKNCGKRVVLDKHLPQSSFENHYGLDSGEVR